MKRKLLTQMRHEWRGNIALMIELLVVSVVLWFIADGFYAHYKVVWGAPVGMSIDNVWTANIATVPEIGIDYNQADSTDNAELLHSIINRMNAKSFISDIATETFAKPYTYAMMTVLLKDEEYPDSVAFGTVMKRNVSPEFLRIFDIHGPEGETPDELIALIRDRQTDILMSTDISTSSGSYYGHDGTLIFGADKNPRNIIGRHLKVNGQPKTVAGLVTPLKRTDVEAPTATFLSFEPIQAYDINGMTALVFKVDPNQLPDATDPTTWFDSNELRAGNIYVTNIRPMTQLKENVMKSSDTSRRNYLVLLAFLVLTVFIGMLGSFWVRTSARTQEIAIRKAAGATNADIFRRFITEGLLMLVIITPLALGADWWLAHDFFNIPAVNDPFVRGIDMAFGAAKEFEQPADLELYFTWPRLLISAGCVFTLMALMVVCATFVPAFRAMKIQPAEALHAE